MQIRGSGPFKHGLSLDERWSLLNTRSTSRAQCTERLKEGGHRHRLRNNIHQINGGRLHARFINDILSQLIMIDIPAGDTHAGGGLPVPIERQPPRCGFVGVSASFSRPKKEVGNLVVCNKQAGTRFSGRIHGDQSQPLAIRGGSGIRNKQKRCLLYTSDAADE